MDFKLGQRKARVPSEIVALDFGSAGVKAVKLRMVRNQVTLVAADLYPPPAEGATPSARFHLAGPLVANYAALCTNSPQSLVRLIHLPAHGGHEQDLDAAVRAQFNLGDGYRMAHTALASGRSKGGTRVLAAALPEAEVQALLGLFATRAPAPHSLEVSGLAVLNTFMQGPGKEAGKETVCLIDCGNQAAFIFFVTDDDLVLMRKYDIGGASLIDHAQRAMGVDRELAMTIMSEGAIDLSGMIQEVMGAFFRQLNVSRDFVERQERNRLRRIYLTGGMALYGFWRKAVSEALAVEVADWDPWRGVPALPGAFPETLEGERARFTAALGAGMGVLQPA